MKKTVFIFLALRLIVETNIYNGIYPAVELAQCISWLAYSMEERGSVPIIVQGNFLMSNPSFMAVTPCLVLSTYRWPSLQETIRSKVELNGTAPPGAVIENAWMYTSTPH